MRKEAKERITAKVREVEKERKRESARHGTARDPGAIRKGKYPMCTQ